MSDFQDEGERLDAVVATNLPAIKPALDHHDYAKLALEIARNIHELPIVLDRWGITTDQYDRIKTNDFFTRVLQQYIIEWNSAGNVKQRLKLEAGAILEDAYPVLAARLHKSSEDLGKIAELAKMFSKTAGVDEEKINSNPGEKFTITINLGEDTKLKFEKDISPTGGSSPKAIPADDEGKTGGSPIPAITGPEISVAAVGPVPKRIRSKHPV